MKTQEIKVTFQPSGRSVYVLPGTTLLEAAGRAGIILQTPCGGQGTCGKCRVKLTGGTCKVTESEKAVLAEELLAAGGRLACQARITEPVVVDVPQESMFESRQQILTGDTGERGNLNPVIRKRYVELSPPSMEDVRSDQARLREAIGDVVLSEDLTRMLPRFFRQHDWRGTVVMANNRVLAIESGDASAKALGIALDLGTTTVVGTLFDLVKGRDLGVASRMNSQVGYGDDVISRILKIRENPGALLQLQESVLETVNLVMADLERQAGVALDNVYEVVVAGNSTMQQIFCGFDPSALGEVPFVQVFDDAQTMSAQRLKLRVNPGAEVFVFPQIGGFVGGDTVAGMLAARLDKWDKPVLLVDIGTNGEIVLSWDGHLLAASTAAGPAFEGARISQGMRAAAGAIEKVIIRDDVLINVIGNTPPNGLCGTGLIDAVADLLRAGIIDETGRILPPDELPDGIPDAVRKRLRTEDGDMAFALAAEDEAGGQAVCLRQKDIRELQLATGAIRAGAAILLRRAGLEAGDLGAVLLAGAFGNFIRRSNARRIGLLPAIPCERIRFIGNAASLGAKLALLSVEERNYARDLRSRARHVDLSRDAEFQMEFSMGMLFPRDEPDACGEEPA